MSDRARWLHVSEVELIRMWGREVSRAFNGEMPYLVGSVMWHKDWRDVDVRFMLVLFVVAVPLLAALLYVYFGMMGDR